MLLLLLLLLLLLHVIDVWYLMVMTVVVRDKWHSGGDFKQTVY
jgi:hypothetical protein